jgi:hypothetical protein
MARDWKTEIVALRNSSGRDVTVETRQILIDACGRALSLREARSRLFLISMAACDGKPQVMDLEGRHLVIMSVNDFAAVICEPTLEEFLSLFDGAKPRRRRKVSNR